MSKVSDERHWITCLGCGWIRSVNNNPPVTESGFCTTCGEPAEDPFDIAREDRAALEAVSSIHEAEPVPRPLVDELTGALRFIMAFYEPGQTYLDTNAWKVAEAGGRNALANGEAFLTAQAAIAGRESLSHTAGEIEAGGEGERLTRERDALEATRLANYDAMQIMGAKIEANAGSVAAVARAEAADKRIARLEEALRQIACISPWPDNDMGNVDLARAALESRQ